MASSQPFLLSETGPFMYNFYIGPPPKKAKTYNESFIEAGNLELSNRVAQLESELAKVNLANNELRKKLLKECRPFVKERKPFSELHPARKCHKKNEIKIWLSAQFAKLPSEWKVAELEMKIGEGLEVFEFEEKEPKNDDIVIKVKKALKAKDDGDVSDLAYRELGQVPGSNLPSLFSVMKERKKQNNIIAIKEFDQDIVKGCYRSIEDILRYMYVNPQFMKELQICTNNNKITLRFSGDGRKTTKKLGSVMTTFCLPSKSSRSPDKEYCISIYDGKESHALLSSSMKKVFKEMSDLQSSGILLQTKTFTVDWLLCADWKFMACLLGINSPCSEFFCLWCECCKKLIRDFSITDWEITRTYSQCCERAKDDFKGDKKGVQKKPIIEIDFTKVIPDTLHLLLRIRGKLLNQVSCWALEQKQKEKMEAAMSSIGVHFNFYDAQDSNGKTVTKWTSLDCDDLEKVIKHLNISGFLTNMTDKSRTSIDCLTKGQLVSACKKFGLKTTGVKDTLRAVLREHLSNNNITFKLSTIQSVEKKALDVSELQTVWHEFEVLADALKANVDSPKYLTPDAFKSKAMLWVKCFRKATFDEDVIPYMHVLVYHVPQFLSVFSTLHHLNCQTVEKKNHMQNRTFHRSSQKGGKNSNYTVQVMQKENRGMFSTLSNLQRQKRKYVKRL